jgi:regulator of protease activity HflC (stomatin/prohibitin superfamily)|nr:MAG TPA: High frequency of lysogenization C protein [Caudoviricetes sp.]
MKKTIGGIISGIVLLIVVILFAKSTVRVPAGYVAIQYSMNGGVKDKVLTQGWHFKSPMVKTTLYSTSLEQSYLTAGKNGDSSENDSFSASSSEGKAIQIDLTFTYQYNSDKVSGLFTRFRGQSGKEVRDGFIKPNIISWTKEVVANYKVSDILGSERANVNTALTNYLNKKFEPYGITISNVSLINITVDEKTQEAINAKITAQQAAETQEINNQTAIKKAKADAEKTRTEAQAKADAQLIEAKAQAEANKQLSSSITDELIRMKEAEARVKHGWVTINGTSTVVTDKK